MNLANARIAESINEIDLGAVPGYEFTDLALAQRFAEDHSEDVRYMGPWRRWLAWTGARWLVDDISVAMARLKETLPNPLLDQIAVSGRVLVAGAHRRLDLLGDPRHLDALFLAGAGAAVERDVERLPHAGVQEHASGFLED